MSSVQLFAQAVGDPVGRWSIGNNISDTISDIIAKLSFNFNYNLVESCARLLLLSNSPTTQPSTSKVVKTVTNLVYLLHLYHHIIKTNDFKWTQD